MWIERCYFESSNPHDWFVRGRIEIDGEFTQEEWNKIKEMFIAMGLFQLKRGKRPSDVVPSRRQVVDAVMEDARNNNTKATEALRVRYCIPDSVTLEEYLAHYTKLLPSR